MRFLNLTKSELFYALSLPSNVCIANKDRLRYICPTIQIKEINGKKRKIRDNYTGKL